jgi:cutinase
VLVDLVRRWTLAATTTTLIAASAVFTPALSPAGIASADDCADIDVTFARGTTEPVGIGAVGQAFVDSLRRKVGGRSVSAYAVNYPASYDFLAAADGANDASAHIQYMVANCPNTRLVLGGYSQGAAVIDVISAVPIPAVGFNNPLPPDVPDHVAAIAVFGNPSAKLGLPLTVSPVWGSRAIDLCNGGDAVCQTDGQSIVAHKNYATAGFTNQAANFVAGLL